MKYLLIIKMCSLVHLNCLPPMVVGTYPTYYECATAGFTEGQRILSRMDKELVNKNRLVLSFSCKEQHEI